MSRAYYGGDIEKSSQEDNAVSAVYKQDSTAAVREVYDGEHEGEVKRALKQRHVQMIAIGGTIGTGLFLGSGRALATGGPVGLLLGYSVMGAVIYSMMMALGEMTTMFPVSGSFTHYASRFGDPALGFALGYNYWYSYAVTVPAEITAASLVIGYWNSELSPAIWISIILVVICSINFFGVKWYGEAEFVFSMIKVTTIVGLIILGIVIDLGGAPSHDRLGFRYWKDPGPFNQLNGIPGAKGRFLAFWSVFVQAAFAYGGTEIVAVTAGEAANPRKTVPKAIRRVFYRILLFYIGGVAVIGLTVPYTDQRLIGGSNANSSPFVIAINNAGIAVLPSIINAAILTSAFSAGNSDVYAASRTLYGLACAGKAPAIFKYCTKGGVPVWATLATVVFGPLAYMNLSNSGATVFFWLTNLASITDLLTWWSILLTYLRFYHGVKYQGIDRTTFAYRAPFQPYASYFGFFFISLVIFFNGYSLFLANSWDTSSFIVSYIALPVFIGCFLFWKLFKRTAIVRLAEMDFDTGRREIEAMEQAEEEKYQPPTTLIGRFWEWLM